MNDILEKLDEVWGEIRKEAESVAEKEPALTSLFEDVILSRATLFEAIGCRIARKFAAKAMPESLVREIFVYVCSKNEDVRRNILRDIVAIYDRDPACSSYLEPVMYFKGFQAICVHRMAHVLWNAGRRHLALYFQSLSSEIYGVDIHPAAKFGGGILLDHATSFVAGETSVVEDDVSILHEVTLGGTSTECGDRHPKVRSGVLIGAGAKLLGNIEIGMGAKIGAGSVVLCDVPAHTTVAGVPAKSICSSKETMPSLNMNQHLE